MKFIYWFFNNQDILYAIFSLFYFILIMFLFIIRFFICSFSSDRGKWLGNIALILSLFWFLIFLIFFIPAKKILSEEHYVEYKVYQAQRAYQNYYQILQGIKKEQEKNQKLDAEVQKRLEEKGLILFPSNEGDLKAFKSKK